MHYTRFYEIEIPWTLADQIVELDQAGTRNRKPFSAQVGRWCKRSLKHSYGAFLGDCIWVAWFESKEDAALFKLWWL